MVVCILSTISYSFVKCFINSIMALNNKYHRGPVVLFFPSRKYK